MGLYILDECSKHGVSGLKVCGYRSPLYRGYLVPVPQDCSQVRICADECLAYLAAQYCQELSGSQHAEKQILEVYRPLLLFWGEYPVLYDY